MIISFEENIIYNMNNIIYLWRFKPNEKKYFPQDVVINNLKYIANYKIINNPSIIVNFIINNNNIFPDLLEIYNKIPHWVIKTDVGRLLAVYLNSGLYVDSDCFIKKKLDKHNDTHNIILFIGPLESFGNIVTADALAVGLQMHLGANAKWYLEESIQTMYPTYLSRRYTPEYIAVNSVQNILSDIYIAPSNTQTLIQNNYKLVDFKIVYSILFDDILQQHGVRETDYVGWGDCDIIYGKISNFIKR
jgi:hypothetical protein